MKGCAEAAHSMVILRGKSAGHFGGVGGFEEEVAAAEFGVGSIVSLSPLSKNR